MAGLLRWQIFCMYGALFLSVWLGARNAIHNNSNNDDDTTPPSWPLRLAIDWMPLWGIVLLGVYAVSWIAYGVLTLRDDQEAAQELDRHVKEAKQELQKRGIVPKD